MEGFGVPVHFVVSLERSRPRLNYLLSEGLTAPFSWHRSRLWSTRHPSSSLSGVYGRSWPRKWVHSPPQPWKEEEGAIRDSAATPPPGKRKQQQQDSLQVALSVLHLLLHQLPHTAEGFLDAVLSVNGFQHQRHDRFVVFTAHTQELGNTYFKEPSPEV